MDVDPMDAAAFNGMYRCLDVEPSATSEQITKAYRKLSLKAHPDKPGGSKAKFLALNRAYKVLKDDNSRAVYDTLGVDIDAPGNSDSSGGGGDAANKLAHEIGACANRAVGTVAMRTVIYAIIVISMRFRSLRGLSIGACAVFFLYGKTYALERYEFIGKRTMVFPVCAWILTAAGCSFIFDALVAGVALGALEYSSRQRKGLAVLGGVVLRWLLGARLWTLVKTLLGELLVLAIAHFIFVLVAALAHEIVEAKLKDSGKVVRGALERAHAETLAARSETLAARAELERVKRKGSTPSSKRG